MPLQSHISSWLNQAPCCYVDKATKLEFLLISGSPNLIEIEKIIRVGFIKLYHHPTYQHYACTKKKKKRTKTRPQSLTHLKPQKLMPIACFQLSMSLNYDFTKTNDCFRTGIVGYLTPFPHITKLPNSRIKIFSSSTLD